MTVLANRLLEWYREKGRKLPWRGHSDPYAVWISEIMLQQTRVEAVVPYYQRWMRRFPNVKTLARASEDSVLKAWEGLGYYSRARNLHAAAKIVISEHGGKLPPDPAKLLKLPGIGRYTAAAIASIAYGLDRATLDGNIRRVLSRLFNYSQPADSSLGEKALWTLAERHMPPGRAGDYNQALMDLGAMVCLPKNPKCHACPLMKLCRAYKLGLQDRRPVLKPRKQIPHFLQIAAVITQKRRVLLAKRPSGGLLGSLWEFPNGRVESLTDGQIQLALRKEYHLRVRRKSGLGVIQHAYSHFKVTVHIFECALISPAKFENMKWVERDRLRDFPMGRIDRQIARKLA